MYDAKKIIHQNAQRMMIIKSELGHYYLANTNTFSLFLSSIDTVKESYA